jgi:hypothetical protein
MDFTPPPEIPQAVITFVESRKYNLSNPDISVLYLLEWKDYHVYYIHKRHCVDRLCGSPLYILNNDQETRWADPYEKTPIYAKYKATRLKKME